MKKWENRLYHSFSGSFVQGIITERIQRKTMKDNFHKFFLFLFVLFCVHTAAAQTPASTYDPFASGTFYTQNTPEPVIEAAYPTGKDNTEMILIPEGPFIMGNAGEGALGSSQPAHRVTLKGYWIDKYEVSNAQYAKCVEVQYCTEPAEAGSAVREVYYGSEDYADYPVIHVTWYQAAAYCAWAGKRLPTEAEWEKAARGDKGYLYPWGNRLPDEIPAQINLFENGDTAPVDSFPEGASPYGVLNMEGNVWEWTADQYDQFFYSISPENDPKSVTGGNEYVIRGFSWAYPFSRYEITTRNFAYILNQTYDLGFRCVYSE